MVDVDLLAPAPGHFQRRSRAGSIQLGEERVCLEQVDHSRTPDSVSIDSHQPEDDAIHHIRQMERLHREAKKYLHEPRTLDHYYNPKLSQKRLEYLDGDQVLTRCLKPTMPEQMDQTPMGGLGETGLQRSHLNVTIEDAGIDHMDLWSHDIESGGPRVGNTYQGRKPRVGSKPDAPTSDLHTAGSMKQILVVSQLWLIKTDSTYSPQNFVGNTYEMIRDPSPTHISFPRYNNETIRGHIIIIALPDLLISSYPERWDSKNERPFQQLIRSVVGKSGSKYNGIESLFHTIVQKSLEFDPSISTPEPGSKTSEPGEKTVESGKTYSEVFRDEILSLVSLAWPRKEALNSQNQGPISDTKALVVRAGQSRLR